MPWIICFRVHEPKGEVIPDLNRQVCFILPIATLPKFPQVPPVFTHPEIDEREVRNLQGLATIDQLAEELPDHLSHEIRRAVAAHMQSFDKKFGAGIELSQHAASHVS
jgi:hypothetical protein